MPTTYSDIKATSEFNARYRSGRKPRPMHTACLLAEMPRRPVQPGDYIKTIHHNDGTFDLVIAPYTGELPTLG